MGVSKERRHASRAVRKERRYRQMYREYARRAGFELDEWQMDVLIAYLWAREAGGPFVWVRGRRGGRMVLQRVLEEEGR